MVPTHDTRILPQLLETNQCDLTPISMSDLDLDIGSLNQFPNPIDEQTIKEPKSFFNEKNVLNQIVLFVYRVDIE